MIKGAGDTNSEPTVCQVLGRPEVRPCPWALSPSRGHQTGTTWSDRYHYTKESPPHQEKRKQKEEGLAWSNPAFQQEGPALATAMRCELPVSLSSLKSECSCPYYCCGKATLTAPRTKADAGLRVAHVLHFLQVSIPAWVFPSQLKSSPHIN